MVLQFSANSQRIQGAKHAICSCVGGGLLAGAMCQPNPGSLPRLVSSFCRNGEGLVCPRYSANFSSVALCLGELESIY